mmetsp:Transcript_12847/g.17849  ORF Transcript_12847/g.17849 Transcript_12847/m.17849 type:complete len:89 (-) Transcript_12847:872-1138(-)
MKYSYFIALISVITLCSSLKTKSYITSTTTPYYYYCYYLKRYYMRVGFKQKQLTLLFHWSVLVFPRAEAPFQMLHVREPGVDELKTRF